VTASGVFPASPTQSFGYKADRGADFGNVIINNWCSVEFVIYDVGAYHMGGNRTKPIGNGTWDALQDYITHPVLPNETFTAPFRETCPNLKNITDPYCADMDKLRGQDVSLKIANITHPSEIMQLGYALVDRNSTMMGHALTALIQQSIPSSITTVPLPTWTYHRKTCSIRSTGVLVNRTGLS
jgi:hypothetical protein